MPNNLVIEFDRIVAGDCITDEVSRHQEVVGQIRRALQRHAELGFCVWFTGLSGAGKSVAAETLGVVLRATGRTVSILDGDEVRESLCKDLGFSRGDRRENVRRIAFVAGEIARHGGIALVAAISPYEQDRREAREIVQARSRPTDRTNWTDPQIFVEVFMDTPLEVCEARDSKGLYAKVRAGQIHHFTGISDPYEPPANSDVLCTEKHSPGSNAYVIARKLRDLELITLPPPAKIP